MAEYIDKQEAIDTVAFYLEDPDGVDHALQSIKSIPTADVQPVKHGRWVFYKPPNDWSEMRLSTKSFYVCDICGHFVYDISNYCPGCGAVMDGGDF